MNGSWLHHDHPDVPVTLEEIAADAAACQRAGAAQEQIDLGGLPDRHAAVRAWRTAPDLVTLNLSEDGVIELGTTLLDRGIGIEAGLFTLADAEAFLAAPWAANVHRVLVEVIFEHNDAKAVELAREIDARVAPLGRPRLWHGDARANWAVVDAGAAAGIDVRVGLEDTIIGRTGGRAPGNPAQVADLIACGA